MKTFENANNMHYGTVQKAFYNGTNSGSVYLFSNLLLATLELFPKKNATFIISSDI